MRFSWREFLPLVLLVPAFWLLSAVCAAPLLPGAEIRGHVSWHGFDPPACGVYLSHPEGAPIAQAVAFSGAWKMAKRVPPGAYDVWAVLKIYGVYAVAYQRVTVEPGDTYAEVSLDLKP